MSGLESGALVFTSRLSRHVEVKEVLEWRKGWRSMRSLTRMWPGEGAAIVEAAKAAIAKAYELAELHITCLMLVFREPFGFIAACERHVRSHFSCLKLVAQLRRGAGSELKG